MTELDPRILQAEATLATAQDQLRLTLSGIQADCAHEALGEAPEQPSESGLFKPTPGFLVCLRCGVCGRSGSPLHASLAKTATSRENISCDDGVDRIRTP